MSTNETTIDWTKTTEIKLENLAIPADNLGRDTNAEILGLEMLRMAQGFRYNGFIQGERPLLVVPIGRGEQVKQYIPTPTKAKVDGESLTLGELDVQRLASVKPTHKIISGNHRTLSARVASVLWPDSVKVETVPCIILTKEQATEELARRANRRLAAIDTTWQDRLRDAAELLKLECSERALWQGAHGELPVYATRGEAIGAFAVLYAGMKAGKTVEQIISVLVKGGNTPSQLIAQRMREKAGVVKGHTLKEALTNEDTVAAAWTTVCTPRAQLVTPKPDKVEIVWPERTAKTNSERLIAALKGGDVKTTVKILDLLDTLPLVKVSKRQGDVVPVA